MYVVVPGLLINEPVIRERERERVGDKEHTTI